MAAATRRAGDDVPVVVDPPPNRLPVAALQIVPPSGTAPLEVTADGSGSRDPDGAIASYLFDFGDGTVVGPQRSGFASHVYAPGEWTARLTVIDDGDAVAVVSSRVSVNAPPVAALTVTPFSGIAPLAVRVDASGSSDPDGTVRDYRFDFGDGTMVGPQAEPMAAHTYAEGSWTATVTVTDAAGAAVSQSVTVTVDRPPNRAPIPVLSVTPSSGTAPLVIEADASDSRDPDGKIVSYRFDFGDGTVAGPQASAVVSHVYAPGNWVARVTVTDDSSATAVDSAGISVNAPPVPALTITPSPGAATLPVMADASGSHDPDGTIVSYLFNFGDGTVVGPQAEAVATHAFAPGEWTVTVTTTDNRGAKASSSGVVQVGPPPNQLPIATLSVTPTEGNPPLAVTADASGSSDPDGRIVSYQFDFGDGTVVGPQSPATASHVYGPGHWTARVRVVDDSGGVSVATASVWVNTPPVAALTATPTSGYSPLDVALDASGSSDPDGSIVSYQFDFGDGSVAGPQASPTALHTYAIGNWTAHVTVTDDRGLTAVASVSLTALNQPPSAVLVIRRGTLEPDSGFITMITDPAPAFTVPSVPRPAYLATATDSIFRTKVKRITDLNGVSLTTATSLGNWGADARHHYSKDQPWNSDGTLLAVQNGGTPKQIFLDGATYQVKYGECTNYNLGDDRWHPSPAHPHERINAKGSELMWFDVVTCTKTRSWTLPFPVLGIGDGEGNPSLDGRYVALCDSSRMFVVDMDPQPPFAPYPSQRIGPVYNFLSGCTLPQCRLGWVGVSPSGKYVVCKYGGDYPRVFDLDPNTLELTPRPMSPDIPHCTGNPAEGYIYDLGHCDMALNPFDHNEDVLIGQEHCGNRGKLVGGQMIGAVVMARLRDGAINALTDPLNEAQAHHVSCQNLDRPGWAYVGYYPQAGRRFTDEIVAVKLDASKAVQRFAHKHSDSSGDCYRCEPHAVPSRDGRRVVWASNWAINCTTCGAKSEIKSYVADARVNSPDTGWTAPAAVTVDASESHDAHGSVVSYRFDFGDGTVAGPQASGSASHTYGAGHWIITITVTDDRGAADTTSAPITVTGPGPPPDRAPVVMAPSSVSGNEGRVLTLNVTAADPDGDAIGSLTADLSGLPHGNDAVFAATPGNKSGTLTWTPTQNDTGGPYRVTFAAANALSGSTTTWITVTSFNLPPVAAVAVAPSMGPAPLSVTVDASASRDSDGTVASYTFDFGDGTVVGPQSNPTATHAYALGNWTVRVTVLDNENATGTAAAAVTALQNLVGNPSFELSTSGWNAYNGSTIVRVPGGLDGGWALEIKGPASMAQFGVNDSPNWVSSVSAAGTRYRFTAGVRSATHTGNARLKVREYLSGVQQGGTNYSDAVALSPTWKTVTMDYVAPKAGNTFDFQVVDDPVAMGEVFQADQISIVIVPSDAEALAQAATAGGNAGASSPRDPAASPSSLHGWHVPAGFSVSLFPNPPNPDGVIRFVTSVPGQARVELFDLLGRSVERLLEEAELPPGRHEIKLAAPSDRGGRMKSGVYFYRVQVAEGARTGRFVILE